MDFVFILYLPTGNKFFFFFFFNVNIVIDKSQSRTDHPQCGAATATAAPVWNMIGHGDRNIEGRFNQ